MHIQTLSINNFASFAESAVNLTEGLWLVTGQIDGDLQSNNGCGKSPLLEAPYWALTGSTVRGVRGGGIVRLGSADCTVRVVFQNGVDTLDITRIWSPRVKSVVAVIGDEEINAHNARDVTESLWQRLDIDRELWLAATFFGDAFVCSVHCVLRNVPTL